MTELGTVEYLYTDSIYSAFAIAAYAADMTTEQLIQDAKSQVKSSSRKTD